LKAVANKKGRVMQLRSLLCGVVLFGMAGEACAADLGESFLRGSTVINQPGGTRWDGFYFGGQVGGNWAGTNFANSTKSLVSFLLRNTTIENENHVSDWTTLGTYDTSGSSYGAFVGYQTQWDSAVIGVEANYNRTSLAMASSDAMRRLFATSDGYNNDVTVIGTSSIRITDYGTFRVRGGWAADNFMPYGFVGIALGRADVTRSARVIASGSATGLPPYSFDQTNAVIKTGDFAYGYAAGLGLDIAVLQNVFVRGEYEYVQFGEFNDLKTHIHTARVAAGLKF
jgi:opacity protein-like surface antigen